MEKGYNKLMKGILAIFTIKLFFLIPVFVIQSCSKDSDGFYEEGELTNLAELNNFYHIAQDVAKNINTNKRFSNFKTRKGLNKKTQFLEGDSQMEAELQASISPLVDSGVDLLRSYGFTNAEIITEFGSLNEPNIAIAAFAIYEAELYAQEGYPVEGLDESIDYELVSFLLGSQPVYAQSNIGNCVLEALGVNAVINGFKGGIKKLGKRGALKLFRKVALRYLGWVGAAVAVVDFADCMGVFNSEPETISAGVPFHDNLTCDDLVRFKIEGDPLSTIYVYKGDINFVSLDDFHITINEGYATYYLNFGDILNPECNISHDYHIVYGAAIDISTIEEVEIPDLTPIFN